MGKGMKAMVAVGALLIFVAYKLDAPMPEGFKEPVKFKLVMAFARTVSAMGATAEALGICTKYEFIYPVLKYWSARVDKSFAVGVKHEDLNFDGTDVRVYYPPNAAKTNGPGFLFIHGGGWATGDVEEYDGFLLYWVHYLQMVAVSVDYKLAPKYKFPVQYEDCLRATKYFMKNAAKFRVDPSRIAIAGDSAGGNMVAAVVLKLRDDNFKPMPKLQVLVYPPLQSIDLMTPSMQQFKDGGALTPYLTAECLSQYAVTHTKYATDMTKNLHVSKAIKKKYAKTHLNHSKIPKKFIYDSVYVAPSLDEGDETIWAEFKDIFLSPYFSPLLVDDLTRLPSTLIYTVEYDVIRDDGILYWIRLKEAGNDVTHLHYTAGFHAILDMVDLFEDSKAINNEILAFMKKKL